MNQELIRLVDGLARDKNINRDVILDDLEAAMLSALRKANPDSGDDGIEVAIDRQSGDITASVDGEEMSVRALGRIAAQTAKQVIIQRIRDAERGSIYEEHLEMRGQIVTGKAVRWEGGSLVVELGRTEALMPRSEQIPGETHRVDERLRAMVLDVKEHPSQVKIILSRTHPDFIRALFDLEVPEVAEGIIEIKALAREAGYRTKVAVNSLDAKVDAVGACVGVRGSRIKNIVEELGGEKIDIVRWNESSKTLIANSLRPAEVSEIALCFELGRATVVVTEDQLSLAIGKRGQNVRLGARLTGWDIDILTPVEFNSGLDVLEKALRKIDGIDTTVVDQIIAMGMVNVLDVEEVGAEPLISSEQGLGLDEALAKSIVITCAEEARRVAAEKEKEKQAAAEAAEAAETAEVQAVEETAEAGEEAAEEPAEAGEEVAEEPAEAAEEPAEAAEEPAEAAEEPSDGDETESTVSDENDDKNQ
ncbi:MAG: transcription termination factor NusA [Phycisphaerae bacterium]|nr:transcription termination factor NusA [Phycisphaerae bacterium]